MAPIELSLVQAFEIERLKREIDAEKDPAELRTLAKTLLRAWFSEQMNTHQAIRGHLEP